MSSSRVNSTHGLANLSQKTARFNHNRTQSLWRPSGSGLSRTIASNGIMVSNKLPGHSIAIEYIQTFQWNYLGCLLWCILFIYLIDNTRTFLIIYLLKWNRIKFILLLKHIYIYLFVCTLYNQFIIYFFFWKLFEELGRGTTCRSRRKIA